MKIKRFVILAVLTISFACNRGAVLDTRTFEIQHLDMQGVSSLIEPYIYGDRPTGAGMWAMSGDLVTVRETEDNLEKIARVLEQYDLPRPSVRLHFQVIQANGVAEPDPEIREIEEQLRTLFRFDGYRLMSTAVIWGTENSHVTQGLGSEDEPGHINVNIKSVRGTPDSGTVRLDVHFQTAYGASLETTVNARAGQTVILGNAQLRRGTGTLILTVRPELVAM